MNRHARLLLVWIIALCAAAVAIAAPSSALAMPINEAIEHHVEESLTCQCGCGLTLAQCNHPNCEFAVPARHKIRVMLAKGMSGAQVIAYFRAKYGEKILSSPPMQGFNVLAWTMPFMALIAGCIFILYVANKWRSGDSSGEPINASPVPEGPVDPELRRRLEREIKDRL